VNNIEKDYWRYYVQIEYDSPVFKIVKDDKNREKRINKCCFPVRLVDWDEYNNIAYPILIISPTYLTRRLELPEEVSLFDFVVYKHIKENSIDLIEKMFTMAFREPVKGMLYRHNGQEEIRFVFESDTELYINRDNYLAVREIMMAQSFYFDPIVGKNERSQEAIDKAIKRIINTKSSDSYNMESQIALVRSELGERDWYNYTYYELRIDYYTIVRKENYRAIHVYRVMGSDVKIPDFSATNEAHINPLGEDVVFKKNDRNKDKY
jgi:hypothetical protein